MTCDLCGYMPRSSSDDMKLRDLESHNCVADPRPHPDDTRAHCMRCQTTLRPIGQTGTQWLMSHEPCRTLRGTPDGT